MTKTQVKNQLKKLIERLEDLRGDLEMLGDDVQETAYDIEPYDGKDELTGGCIGIVNLKDGFAFYDGSHIQAFRTKKDLIELLKKDVNKE